MDTHPTRQGAGFDRLAGATAPRPTGAPRPIERRGGVSVVIPTFQRADVLPDCLDAFLRQLRPQDELLVVVDGSTDQTAETLRAYYGRIRTLNRDNGGRSLAANDGVLASTAPYVWVFDDDDLPLPGALDELAVYLDARPELDFCVTPWRRAVRPEPDAPAEPTNYVIPMPDVETRGLLPPLFESNYIGGASMFARRRVYDEVGLYDPRFARSQDYHFAVRAALRVRFDIVSHEPTFLYVTHGLERGPQREIGRAHV
mgnify:CR=1 FL=1